MTTSTSALTTTLRSRLLTFQASGSPTPDTLADVLTDLYLVQGPAKTSAALFPYGIMRIENRAAAGEYFGERETMELELQLFGRPRSEQGNVETYADIADQALLRYQNNASGFIFSGSRLRDTLPVMSPPADRDVVAVRCVYSLIVWPVFLTQYSGS